MGMPEDGNACAVGKAPDASRVVVGPEARMAPSGVQARAQTLLAGVPFEESGVCVVGETPGAGQCYDRLLMRGWRRACRRGPRRCWYLW